MMAAGRLTAISTPGGSIPLDSVTPAGRATLLVTSVLAVAVLLKGLYHLRALLGNYSRREVFAVDSAREIRQFGITCVLWGVLKIVSGFLPLILLGDARDPTHIELDDLLMGAVIIVISWFAEMAAAVREENDLTI